MNPPYLKPEKKCKKNCDKKICKQRGYHINKDVPGTGAWVRKAYEEARRGMVVVCLIAARSDLPYWHKYCMNATEVWFICHRLKFEQPGQKPTSAPFPSAIVVFDGLNNKLPAKTVYKSIKIDAKTKEIKLYERKQRVY